CSPVELPDHAHHADRREGSRSGRYRQLRLPDVLRLLDDGVLLGTAGGGGAGETGERRQRVEGILRSQAGDGRVLLRAYAAARQGPCGRVHQADQVDHADADRLVLAGRLIAALNRQHKNAPHVGAFFIVGAPVPARIRGRTSAPTIGGIAPGPALLQTLRGSRPEGRSYGWRLEDPLGEFGGELLEGDGFAEVVVHAAFHAAFPVRAHGVCRQSNDRDAEAVILLLPLA